VAEALKERARAGLDVRVIYDAIGSLTTPAAFFRELEEAGVKVHAYHTFAEALRRFAIFHTLNRRNHRKLVVIDDRVAYFGGMNIIDPNALVVTEQAAERLLKSVGWRDVQVRLEGPQQREVAESFERSWLRAHHRRVSRRPRAYRQARLAPGEESIQFFDSGPGLRNTRAARVFAQLFREAKQTITLSIAYFLPLGRVLRELLRARKRGVEVRVIVPGLSDVKLVRRATCHLYTRLLKRRIRIYERQLHVLHSKVAVIDQRWTVVGSCNLDPRSLWINLEFLAVIHSENLARVMKDVLKEDFAQSHRVTLPQWYRRGCRERLLDRLAWSLRWWL
jgi:cardiolipin synthase